MKNNTKLKKKKTKVNDIPTYLEFFVHSLTVIGSGNHNPINIPVRNPPKFPKPSVLNYLFPSSVSSFSVPAVVKIYKIVTSMIVMLKTIKIVISFIILLNVSKLIIIKDVQHPTKP